MARNEPAKVQGQTDRASSTQRGAADGNTTDGGTGGQALRDDPKRLGDLVERLTTELAAANEKIQHKAEERDLAEDRLQSLRAELETIVDAMPAMLFYKDTRNRILRVNREAARRWGVTPREMANTPTSRWYPDEADAYYQDDLEVIRTGVPKLNIVERLYVGNGQKLWVQTDKVPYRNASGQIIGVVVFVRDITLRKQVEKRLEKAQKELEAEVQRKLQASESRYRTLYNNTPVMMHSINRDGRIISVNDHWLHTLGYEREEVVGRRSTEFLTEASRRYAVEEVLPEFFKSGSVSDIEYQMVRKDGWVIEVLLSAVIQRDGAGGALSSMAFMVDVTRRKRAEEQARRHLEEVAHMARLSTVGELAASLAHEINQPLAAISVYTQHCAAVLSEKNFDSQELSDTMEKVSSQCHRVSEIVRRLRAYVHKGQTQRSHVDINYIVHETVALIAPKARSSRVEVNVELSGAPIFVEADNVQIEQIILNLATNAIEAMEDRSSDHRGLTMRVAPRGQGRVAVTVSDTGPGVAEEVLSHIFEPFYTTKPHGMGMGLSISRTIAEAHGGKISVTGNPDGGVSFVLSLPVGEPATP